MDKKIIQTNKSNSLSEYYDFLYLNHIATEDEIQLVTGIYGWNVETLNDILYYKTGYRDKEQYEECEPCIED